MPKIKRGRPRGSKNKKRRGRPQGSKNKLTEVTPIIIVDIKCKKCKRNCSIRTDKKDLYLYTPELKKNYICLLCK